MTFDQLEIDKLRTFLVILLFSKKFYIYIRLPFMNSIGIHEFKVDIMSLKISSTMKLLIDTVNDTNFNFLYLLYFFISVPPSVQLMLGPMINPTDLEEGDDVYFECNVKANPPAYKLTWWHNVSVFISISITIIIQILLFINFAFK